MGGVFISVCEAHAAPWPAASDRLPCFPRTVVHEPPLNVCHISVELAPICKVPHRGDPLGTAGHCMQSPAGRPGALCPTASRVLSPLDGLRCASPSSAQLCCPPPLPTGGRPGRCGDCSGPGGAGPGAPRGGGAAQVGRVLQPAGRGAGYCGTCSRHRGSSAPCAPTPPPLTLGKTQVPVFRAEPSPGRLYV